MKIKTKLIFILIIISINLLVFLPSVSGDFIWDDKELVVDNPLIKNPNFLNLFILSANEHFSHMAVFFRPITLLSFWIDYQFWNLNPAGFHITNLAFHILNAILILFIIHTLTSDKTISLLSAILFSIFPTNFENVSWISGRTDLLALTFTLLAVFLFIKFLKNKHIFYLIISAFFYLVSLFAKENSLMLIVIFLLILWQRKNKPSKVVKPMWPFFLTLIFWIMLRFFLVSLPALEFSGRNILDGISLVGFYSLKIIFPFNLSLSVNQAAVFQSGFFKISGVLIIIFLIMFFFLILKKKIQKYQIIMAVISIYFFLLPAIIIIYFASIKSPVAWRFLYIPSAIFSGCLAYLIIKSFKSRIMSTAILLIIAILYTVEIYPRNKLFAHKEKIFWRSIQNIQKESLMVQFNQASAWLDLNEKKSMEIYQNILKACQSDSECSFYKSKIFENLALFYFSKRNIRVAEKYFDLLFKIKKTHNPAVYYYYAKLLRSQGKNEPADKIMTGLSQKHPSSHKAQVWAARYYLDSKQFSKAKEILTKNYQMFGNQETLKIIREITAKINSQENKKQN